MKKSYIYVLLALAVLGVVVWFTVRTIKIHNTNVENGSYPCPINDTAPMYGCASYDEYISKRDASRKSVDDAFIKTVSSMGKNNPVLDSNSVNQEGWDLLNKGDIVTARKRFNEAWLVDHNNFVTFWLFGMSYGEEAKYDLSLANFEKAVSMYDKKYATAEDDHTSLICDRAKSYLENASLGEDSTKKVELLNKAVDSIEAEVKAKNAISVDCLITETGAYAGLGNKTKAVEKIREAVALDPSLKDDQDLKGIMQELGVSL